jgi:hypothetical protein
VVIFLLKRTWTASALIKPQILAAGLDYELNGLFELSKNNPLIHPHALHF